MKYYLPLLFFSFSFLNCGRDNSETDEIPMQKKPWKKETTCDWCKTDLPDNAFCYYDKIKFLNRTGNGLYELDSIYLDRSPLPCYYVHSYKKKNWINKHPYNSRKYSLSTLLLNTSIEYDFEGNGFRLSPYDLLLQPYPIYKFCGIKCVKNFNENVKFSKPLNSKFMFTNNDN